jgi:membrane protease YdiL (CAAX protease family)
MNILDTIKQLENTINVTDLIICLAGMIFLGYWLLKTSLGINALADSTPRRNNMPLYLPFIPFFIWFGIVSLAISVTEKVLADLTDWQSAFWDNLILCIGAIPTIAVIVFLARANFARRLKGFGLDIKTIHRDFFAAVVNLLSIWPLMLAVIFLTIFFGKLIWGPDFNLEQHEELKTLTEYPQLSLRVLIIITAVVVGPVLEEMLFRGLLQTMIRSFFCHRGHREHGEMNYKQCNSVLIRVLSEIRNGAWFAILISSALFMTVHANVGHWPALFILGLCLGYSYEKSGSLLRPIFIHSLFNAIIIITVLLASPSA